MPPPEPTLSAAEQAGWAIGRQLCAVFVFCVFAHGFHFNANQANPYVPYIEGTSHNPYVGRVLVPQVVRGLTSVVPEASRKAVGDGLLRVTGIGRLVAKVSWDRSRPLEHVLGLLVALFSLVGFAEVLQRLGGVLYRAPPRALASLAPVILLSLPPFFGYRYLYDLCGLLLFGLALLAIVQRRWVLFVVATVLATLNRETAVLLPLVGLLALRWSGVPMERRRTALLLVTFASVVAIRGLITWHFADNPGGMVEHGLGEHAAFLLQPYEHRTWALAMLGAGLVVHRILAKPAALRAMAAVGPVLLLAFLPFGFRDEVRVFLEVWPALLLLAAPSAFGLFGWELTDRTA